MNITSHNLDDNFKRYILKNDKLEVSILNYGCIIEKIIYEGVNVVLSYDDFKLYINNPSYMGAVVAPVAGRIENGAYNLRGEEVKLKINSSGTNLHSEDRGLSNDFFNAEIKEDGLYLTKTKDDVDYLVKYSIEGSNFKVEHFASSKYTKYINMTNHSYFNLSGLKDTVLEHELRIDADYYTELKSNMTPLKLSKVDKVFDFIKPKLLSENINDKHSQFDITYYFDHAFKLNKNELYDITLYSKLSNIELNIKTNQKFAVIYAGNFLNEVPAISGRKENERHIGLAIETQNMPNGINMRNEEYYDIIDENNGYYNTTTYIFKRRV